MGTKKNPGKFDCYNNLKDDEPYFVIMGRDPVGSFIINNWILLRQSITEKGEDGESVEKEKFKEASELSLKMSEYAKKVHGKERLNKISEIFTELMNKEPDDFEEISNENSSWEDDFK
ncbi:MAG: hypothetical protein R3321_00985 [Nitrososphaeraceae archaeon]|nr:hypothetical protein [Nitrososphaeraceae archaeon]